MAQCAPRAPNGLITSDCLPLQFSKWWALQKEKKAQGFFGAALGGAFKRRKNAKKRKPKKSAAGVVGTLHVTIVRARLDDAVGETVIFDDIPCLSLLKHLPKVQGGK